MHRHLFSAISDSYDSKPWFAKVNNQVADALRADLSWVGIPLLNNESSSSNGNNAGNDATTITVNTEQVRLLDYACGTGLMTRVCLLFLFFLTAFFFYSLFSSALVYSFRCFDT